MKKTKKDLAKITHEIEKELKQLAIDISENKVFGTFHMSENEMAHMSVVFMPTIMMDDKQRKDMIKKEVVHFYEYYDQAGPRSVNGMPCFFSMRCIYKNNWIKIQRYIKEYEAKVSSFLDKKQKIPDGPTLFDIEGKI